METTLEVVEGMQSTAPTSRPTSSRSGRKSTHSVVLPDYDKFRTENGVEIALPGKLSASSKQGVMQDLRPSS
jgi:hypothetical protein